MYYNENIFIIVELPESVNESSREYINVNQNPDCRTVHSEVNVDLQHSLRAVTIVQNIDVNSNDTLRTSGGKYFVILK